MFWIARIFLGFWDFEFVCVSGESADLTGKAMARKRAVAREEDFWSSGTIVILEEWNWSAMTDVNKPLEIAQSQAQAQQAQQQPQQQQQIMISHEMQQQNVQQQQVQQQQPQVVAGRKDFGERVKRNEINCFGQCLGSQLQNLKLLGISTIFLNWVYRTKNEDLIIIFFWPQLD